MKDNTFSAFRFNLRGFHQMPGDGFAFTIRVSRQVDVFRLLSELLELFDYILLLIGNTILWREIIFHIHRELRFQQITNMPHRSADGVTLPEVTPNCLRLGWRLNDHK